MNDGYRRIERSTRREMARRQAQHGMRVSGASVKLTQQILTRKAEAARAGR